MPIIAVSMAAIASKPLDPMGAALSCADNASSILIGPPSRAVMAASSLLLRRTQPSAPLLLTPPAPLAPPSALPLDLPFPDVATLPESPRSLGYLFSNF